MLLLAELKATKKVITIPVCQPHWLDEEFLNMAAHMADIAQVSVFELGRQLDMNAVKQAIEDKKKNG